MNGACLIACNDEIEAVCASWDIRARLKLLTTGPILSWMRYFWSIYEVKAHGTHSFT